MRFLGLTQAPVTLADAPALTPLLEHAALPLSGYTFATLLAWRELFDYGTSLAAPDLLLISFQCAGSAERHLLQPVGRLSEELCSRLAEEAERLPYPLKIMGATREFLDANPALVARCDVHEDRDNANYLYSAKELAELPGRRFSPKRNLIAQAAAAYSWTTEPLHAANADECRQVIREVLAADPRIAGGPRRWEVRALEQTLDHWDVLGQKGLLVRVEGRPAAFSVWEPLDPGTAVIHFEWALRAYKGLYQVVNREAARQLVADGFEFVNREEDIGDAGLRQAKLSYNPVRLVGAWTLTLRCAAMRRLATG